MSASYPSVVDATRMSVTPLISAATYARITLSTTSAATSAALAKGWYVISLYAPSGLCAATFGNTATLGATGAVTSAHFGLRDGEKIYSDGTAKLAAILTAGTGELFATLLL
jgi:hypothetical protein